MVEIPLLNQLKRFDQWLRELPRGQRALVNGMIWFVMWFGIGLLFGEQPFWRAIEAGVLAVVFAGLHYRWAPQSSRNSAETGERD